MESAHDVEYFTIENCPIAATMSVIDGKWKMIILYAIFGGINRFGAIRKKIPGLSKKMLTKELREMEQAGLIERKVFPEVPPRVEYELTEKGVSLGKVADALEEWGLKWLIKRDRPIAQPVPVDQETLEEVPILD